MGVKVSKPSPIFVKNMSVVLYENNSEISLNKKTVVLSYHFVRENVANDVVEVRKIDTNKFCARLFTKALVSNKNHGFYHELMVNG